MIQSAITGWVHRHVKVAAHPYEGIPLAVVSGVGRSGTTVLRHALSAHREVHSTGNENNILYDVLGTARQNCTFPSRRATMHVAPPAYDRQWRMLILNLLWPEPRRGRRRPAALLACSDLTPERAEYLQRIFPGCRIVYIVRNGIAVVASRMVKRDFRDYPFEHHCRVWAGAKAMAEWGGGQGEGMEVGGRRSEVGGDGEGMEVGGRRSEVGGDGEGMEVGGQRSAVGGKFQTPGPTSGSRDASTQLEATEVTEGGGVSRHLSLVTGCLLPTTNNHQLTTSPTGGFILIRQEDLLVAGQARVTIDGAIAALGLAPDPACAEVIVKQTFHPTVVEGENAASAGDLASRQERWQLWTDEQRAMFAQLCGDGMRYFGYEMPWE